ncbi:MULTISPECIES: DUF3515 domain-containing protein [Gordonia]|uniref:DUF3515 domain-containing protein n=1 Tax=Gordonia amicalis TaxID=89053 RepID=A0AAE4R4T5_9ACTN|nr:MULTISPECIES: DUF3515 domain-containing protein [Gordonia]ATD71571.1 DUF3515 domain-containing protein [Gordonia sp. 1D]KAF0967735.1 hypothetical protein BPODLACK_03688 [Gordonia sp. YY1]MBA5849372.1 DUF3515 domain-containing protein [Gordonia amicalis]MCR8896600.1 DUF3515 domain-containing protein [Gordonia sp. GONU]MCZ0913887.1 DUF3515 domain-containing protein [Gordonia amicalis]
MTSAGSDDTPQDPENDKADDPAAGDLAGPEDPAVDERYGAGSRLSPALIATLVAIPVMVIAGFIAFAALRPETVNPVESYASDGSASADCTRLLDAAPQRFEGFGDKEISGDRATWPAEASGDDLTLRCGVTRPAELSPTSNLQEIHAAGRAGVQWFITDTVDGSGQAYVSVDHRPYVALWVPSNAGNGPITDISGLIDQTLERGPLDFG